jgi:uncharacterized membrane protein
MIGVELHMTMLGFALVLVGAILAVAEAHASNRAAAPAAASLGPALLG